VTTGDLGRQCRILRTADGFWTHETIRSGDESWRAVTLEFTRDAIYYATDAEYEENSIFRIDRQSGRSDRIGPIPGTVLGSLQRSADIFFAVCAELCPSNADRTASIRRLNASGEYAPLVTAHKDRYPRRLSPATLPVRQYLLPNWKSAGDEERFYFTAMGLTGVGGMTFRVRRTHTF
jgi:hypothetical protein